MSANCRGPSSCHQQAPQPSQVVQLPGFPVFQFTVVVQSTPMHLHFSGYGGWRPVQLPVLPSSNAWQYSFVSPTQPFGPDFWRWRIRFDDGLFDIFAKFLRRYFRPHTNVSAQRAFGPLYISGYFQPIFFRKHRSMYANGNEL